MPKVSIITPCYNAERFLERTIQSVRVQTLAAWEHVIVDDGSADRSGQIAQSCAQKDKRIRLVRQENRGVNAARNAGFSASCRESDYLLFLDADDVLCETALEIMAAYMDEHPSVGMAYCDFARIDEDGLELPRQDHPPRLKSNGQQLVPVGWEDPETPLDTMLWWLYLPPSSALMRRAVYESLSGWDESFAHGCEDTDFLLRFALMSTVHFIPEALVGYRVHAGQATKKGWFMKRQRGVLHAKWLKGVGLSVEQKRAFVVQWRLYESRLLPSYLLNEARATLARGGFRRAAKLTIRAAAHLAIYCTAPCRWLAWPYLWYFA